MFSNDDTTSIGTEIWTNEGTKVKLLPLRTDKVAVVCQTEVLQVHPEPAANSPSVTPRVWLKNPQREPVRTVVSDAFAHTPHSFLDATLKSDNRESSDTHSSSSSNNTQLISFPGV